MNDQVEEIKRKNNIVDIVGQYVVLKKLGRHHKGLSPFHSEKTPSYLVNEELNPGTYELSWDAADSPSGIYFYELRVGSFSQTKKMILLK